MTTGPTLVPLGRTGQALKSLTGRPVPPDVLARWVTRGVLVEGRRVKLAAVKQGRTWLTSADALAAFAATVRPPIPDLGEHR